MTIEQMMWLFPIIFMMHEFEEIIFMPKWFSNNRHKIVQRFPVIGQRIVLNVEGLSTSAFALIVAEEFAIVVGFTLLGIFGEHYLIFGALVTAFVVHLLVHIVQAVIWQGYIPALLTSMLAIPYCVYLIVVLNRTYTLMGIPFLLTSLMMSIFVLLNLVAMHRLAKRIWHKL